MGKRKTSKRRKHKIIYEPKIKKRRKQFKPISIILEGEPLTKSNRHTIRFKNGKSMLVIPTKMQDYEKKLRIKAVESMLEDGGYMPTKELISMQIIYYLGTKRRKDIQNLPKTTCDALNQIVYEDDSQIHELFLYRMLDRENPRVEIIVEGTSDSKWQED